MSRLTLVLLVALGVLVGAFGVLMLNPAARPLGEAEVRAIAEDVVARAPKGEPGLTEAAVETIIADLLARQPRQNVPAAAGLDAATLNPMIEDYLLGNPRILQRVTTALETELAAARLAETKVALATVKADLYDDPGQIVLGNPEGDVTLVELFDYNCSYCRQALPDLAILMQEDPNLRVILKEFPILSQASVEAARVAVQVAAADVDYWAFHQALFTSRGQVDKAAALAAASGLGLNPITLELNMNTPRVVEVIETSYRIANELKISGTPTFIIGNEVIPGAIGLEGLRSRIKNMRECGETVCPVAQPG